MNHLSWPFARLFVVVAGFALAGCTSTIPVSETPYGTCSVKADFFGGLDEETKKDPLCLKPIFESAPIDIRSTSTDVDGGGTVVVGALKSTDTQTSQDKSTPPKTTTTTTNTTTFIVSISTKTTDPKPTPPAAAAVALVPKPAQYNGQVITVSKAATGKPIVTINPADPKNEAAALDGTSKNYRKQLLTEMYYQATAYCLYYKNKKALTYKLGLNFYNFGDVLIAAAVPVAAFSGATSDTIALISGLLTILGSPLKSALGSADPGEDYSQTTSGMSALYALFSTDGGFIDDVTTKSDPQAMFKIFKTGLEQTCFSSLSNTAAAKPAGTTGGTTTGGSSAAGQGT